MTHKSIKYMALVTFMMMLIINIVADIALLNGVSTKEISNIYTNLYVPSNYTFVIWGLIFIYLGIYAFYQLKDFDDDLEDLIREINLWFILGNIINSVWVFAWHYEMMTLSFILITLLMLTLVGISFKIQKIPSRTKERYMITFPFSFYFGWIAVATIANLASLLTYYGYKVEPIITIFLIVVGIIAGVYVTYKKRIIGFGLMLIWGYIGILFRHVSPSGYNNKYPEIIVATLVSIAVMVVLEIYMMIKHRKEERVEE